MGNETNKLATAAPAESLARRTLIRAFEGQIIAKVQEDNGQEGDHQAPMTLLKNPDGTPRKLVAATTDQKMAEEWIDAINRGVPVAVNVHHAPTDDELEELSRQLPMVQPPAALPPPPEGAARVLPPMVRGGHREVIAGGGPCTRCDHPACAHENGRCVAVVGPGEQCSCGRPPLDVQPSHVTDEAGPGAAHARVAVEPNDRAPFVLRIRDGRTIVHEAGPYATVTQAWDAMQARGGAGQEATIYEHGRVADYRGGRAMFAFGRTRWSRAS